MPDNHGGQITVFHVKHTHLPCRSIRADRRSHRRRRRYRLLTEPEFTTLFPTRPSTYAQLTLVHPVPESFSAVGEGRNRLQEYQAGVPDVSRETSGFAGYRVGRQWCVNPVSAAPHPVKGEPRVTPQHCTDKAESQEIEPLRQGEAHGKDGFCRCTCNRS